jgi:hypothetical protein
MKRRYWSGETDKEFLERMAGEVNSECWGTPKQEADQARFKDIAEKLSEADALLDTLREPLGLIPEAPVEHILQHALDRFEDYKEVHKDKVKFFLERDEARAHVDRLQRCVLFFSSVIKSGEPWTDECEESIQEALRRV